MRYLNFLYGTDTYGVRVRGDITLKAVAVDYDKVLVTVGSIPSEFPYGSRIYLARTSGYWPAVPASGPLGAFNDDTLFSGTEYIVGFDSLGPPSVFPTTYTDNYLSKFKDYYSPLQQTEADVRTTIVGFDGYTEIPRYFIDTVTPGTVTYYRVYVSEPLGVTNPDLADNEDHILKLLQEREDSLSPGSGLLYRWSPWEVRGQTYVVAPNRFGGEQTVIDSYPVGLMTGGDVYGVVDKESTQYQFLCHLGFLADQVSTDGSLIVDQIDFLHPNMVRPLLYGFGITESEYANVNGYYATWNAVNESPYLKNLLFSYRDLVLRKGSPAGVTDYYEKAFGMSGLGISIPENLVLSVIDSSPWDLTTPGALFDDRGVHLTSSRGTWEPVPRLRDSSLIVVNAQWTRQYTGDATKQYPPTEAGLWTDIMTDTWVNGPQDSLAGPGAELIPDVLGDYFDFQPGVDYYFPEVMADLPAAYWRDDTVVDSSGNNRSMSAALVGDWIEGIVPYASGNATAEWTTGTGGRVTYASWMNSTQISAEVWFKTYQGGALISRGWFTALAMKYWTMNVSTSTGFLYMGTGDSSNHYTYLTGNIDVRDGQLHHAVMTLDHVTGERTLYLDGVLHAQDTATYYAQPTAFDMALASQFSTGTYNTTRLIGEVDEIAYYTHLLTPERVAAHYSAGADLGDPWRTDGSYEQHTDFVYQLQIDAGELATIGSRTVLRDTVIPEVVMPE